MFRKLAPVLAFLVLPASTCVADATADEALRIHGFVEWVHVAPVGFDLKARLDTGAKTSSIDADSLETLDRDGTEYARFRLDDHEGHAEELELEIVRWVIIKRKQAPSIRRPVVELAVCLGDVERKVEFSLAERDGFLYPMLLGRNFLAHHVLVDSAHSLTTKPRCSKEEPAG